MGKFFRCCYVTSSLARSVHIVSTYNRKTCEVYDDTGLDCELVNTLTLPSQNITIRNRPFFLHILIRKRSVEFDKFLYRIFDTIIYIVIPRHILDLLRSPWNYPHNLATKPIKDTCVCFHIFGGILAHDWPDKEKFY